MRVKYFLLSLVLVGSISSVRACEACGCSIMFWDLGITPRFQSHQISLGWQYQAFNSFASFPDLQKGQVGSQEQFYQLDLQTQWRLHQRWRLNISLPYSFLERSITADEAEWQMNGWSDPSALLQFVAIDQDEEASSTWRHRLSVGAGIKFPWGESNSIPESETVQANFRLGTGSTDAMLYLQYVLRKDKWGVSLDGLFSRNGENAEEYQYGHRASGHLNFFGVFSAGKVGIMPSAGLYHEQAQMDVQRSYFRSHTGGYYTFGQIGTQLFWPGFSAMLRYQLPLAQNWADGLTEAEARWALQVSYFL